MFCKRLAIVGFITIVTLSTSIASGESPLPDELWKYHANWKSDASEHQLPWIQFPVNDHEEKVDGQLPLISYNGSSIQGLHLALFDKNTFTVTWLHPAKYEAGTYSPRCSFTIDGETFFKSKGVAYTYNGGCFDSTLNVVAIKVSKSIKGVYPAVKYACGDKLYGMSQWFKFHRAQSMISNTSLINEEHDMSLKRDNVIDSVLNLSYRDGKTGIVPALEQNENVFSMQMQLHKPLVENIEANILKNTESSTNGLVAIVGDMSTPSGDNTIALIKKFTALRYVRLLVHAGDISYADEYDQSGHPINNSYVWTDYINNIADIATQIPYMTCPGNHEQQFNFTAYLNWFPTSGYKQTSGSDFYYSFDYMGVHYLMMSTEHDFSTNSRQNKWIVSDLIKANRNRKKVPWIVVFGHRPFYCTNSKLKYQAMRCSLEASAYRVYLEDVFYEQKVDAYICGHNHDYERTFPVYKKKVTSKDYINPNATVYIVNGEAGNVEGNSNSFLRNVSWRAFYNPNKHNGFLLMQPSKNQLSFTYIDSTLNKIIDKFKITRTLH